MTAAVQEPYIAHEVEDPAQIIRAVNIKNLLPDRVNLKNEGFTQTTLFDPEKHFFNDTDQVENISE